MKFLIDIGHPAHVHYFKNLTRNLLNNNHEVLFTCRDKDVVLSLLEHHQFNYISFGKNFKSKAGKIFGLFYFTAKLILVARKFKPDIYLNASIYSAFVAWIFRKPHISLEDTGNWEQVRLYLPFTKTVLTSNVFPFEYGQKQIRYTSHQELAYLNPKYFIPNENFRDKLGLSSSEKYVIIRFVSWQASHDFGQKGLTDRTKKELIKTLSEKYKIYISSESALPIEFENYRAPFPPESMHDALNNAELFIGEGTTMAMEAAILGTPSFYINSLQYANVLDMEYYGLLFSFNNDEALIQKMSQILSIPDFKVSIQNKRLKMLSEKIDLTAFLVWFVENYPQSQKIMKDNPDYQYNFK